MDHTSLAARWQGKKVWLIGASTGIGKALAERLAAEGAQLALSARSGAALVALAASLPGGPHRAIPFDVSDEAACKTACEALFADWPALDCMVFNAGTYTPQAVVGFDLAEAKRTVEVNLLGALNVLAQVVPKFAAQKYGQIAMVGSVAGYRGLPNGLAYAASKAGLINLTETLRLELEPRGIDVKLINPGFVKTPLTDRNPFPMPFIISAESAAERIVRGLEGTGFEIHFPRRFSGILKFLQLLPYRLYFPMVRKFTGV